MCTPQAALKGLKRSMSYTQSRCQSESAFYSSTVETLVEIRELASQLMELANKALEKVDLDEEKYVLNSAITQSSDSYLCEVSEEPQELAFNDGQSSKLPKLFSKNFKKILKDTSNNSESTPFDYKPAEECSKVCFKYFELRFDSRYDPNKVHTFNQKNFKEYLTAMILWYSLASYRKELDTFYDEFDSFCNDIKSKENPYTLPKSAAEIFFNVLKHSETTLFEYPREAYLIGNQIWCELWRRGYSNLSKLDTTITATFDWVNFDVISDCDIIHSCDYLDICDCTSYEALFSLASYRYEIETQSAISVDVYPTILSIFLKYVDLTFEPVFDAMRYAAADRSTAYASLCTEGSCSIPSGTVAKSLMFYAGINFENISKLETQINKLTNTVNELSKTYNKYEDIASVLNEYQDVDLELVDVFTLYFEEYEEHSRGTVRYSNVTNM